MDNKEQATTSMFNGTNTYVVLNNGVVTGNVPFETEWINFLAKRQLNFDAGLASGANNSGFSDDKLIAKKAGADECLVLI